MFDPSFNRKIVVQSVYIGGIRYMTVVGTFMKNVDRNQDTSCNSYAESEDIDESKSLISAKVSPGDFYIVLKHDFVLLFSF